MSQTGTPKWYLDKGQFYCPASEQSGFASYERSELYQKSTQHELIKQIDDHSQPRRAYKTRLMKIV